MPKTLYICYFGLREPLVQTQVLPYLRELAHGALADSRPLNVSLLTFEPEFRKSWNDSQIEAERTKLQSQGIDWHATAYHKWPSVPATFYDIVNGTRIVRKLLAKNGYDVLHGRVHIPMLIGALARKLSRRKPKLLFDIRGFFPEEYTDAGRWPEGGWLYRSAKRIEKWLLKESDGFVVLTEKARDILFPESKSSGVDKYGRPVEVIPCCVDLSRFHNAAEIRMKARRELGIEERRVLIYLGSFGGWYQTSEMLDLFSAAKERDPKTFVIILTQRDKEKIARQLEGRGFSKSDFLVESVSPDDVVTYLAAADVAVSFIKACYSKLSSSPTKIAEYLACGLPVIANKGVGDIDGLINENGVGTMVNDYSISSYVDALESLSNLNGIGNRCREVATREFDLAAVGGARYRRLYSKLLGNSDGRVTEVSD